MTMPPSQPRKSKQQMLADAILCVGALGWLRKLHDRGRTPVPVLAYHRIATIEQPDAYPLDLGLVSATAREFDQQMRLLREFANPVSLDDIADAVTHGRTLPDRPVAVTFDDGFSDTFDVAFPILRRHGIPATIFVSTNLVESPEPFWFEITAHLMLRVPAGSIRIDGSPALPTADGVAERRQSIAILHGLLKHCSNSRRSQLLDEWQARYATSIDANARELSRSVSREQVREMAAGGVSFGSHTMSHPNLALATTDSVQAELRGSKAWLEEMLGRPVRSLAYPFGTPDTYDARALSIARACGYELAMSFRQGINWLGSLDAMELRRIGISPGVTANQFRAMLALGGWLHPNLSDDHH
jgi:peptidoglycan/xylan/chitin deacetylase (PgdA/CDA1 family)